MKRYFSDFINFTFFKLNTRVPAVIVINHFKVPCFEKKKNVLDAKRVKEDLKGHIFMTLFDYPAVIDQLQENSSKELSKNENLTPLRNYPLSE